MAKFKIETSSGGVLYRLRDNSIEVALALRTTQRGESVWCLPKGKIEQKEGFEQTALREVAEETGMNAEIVDRLGSISYWFYDTGDKSRINKTVHFYLMRYISGSPQNHDREVEEVRWFQIEQALSRSSYKSEREIIEKAKQVLESVSEGDRK